MVVRIYLREGAPGAIPLHLSQIRHLIIGSPIIRGGLLWHATAGGRCWPPLP
jgi:hypothetical protein